MSSYHLDNLKSEELKTKILKIEKVECYMGRFISFIQDTATQVAP